MIKLSANASSDALRAIGSDLDLRGIKTFHIECKPGLFVVEAGYQSPPAATPITLHYTSDDIEQLNRKLEENNDRASAAKDFLALSQILWAIGAYVENKGDRLLSISNTASTEMMPAINIEYQTAEGDRVVDSRRGSAIYEFCVNVYKAKTKSNPNNPRYTRFSTL